MSIISPSGWFARYASHDGASVDDLPVAYFRRADDEPLVVVQGEPRPRPAISLPGFKGLVACPRTAAAIPSAPGWLLRTHDDQGKEHTTTIIGWVVDEQGEGAPIVVYDRNGRCYAASKVFAEYTVHGPVPLGATPTPEPEAGQPNGDTVSQVRSVPPASRKRPRGSGSSDGTGS